MKIIINENNEEKRINLPDRLILNSITATIVPKMVNKKTDSEFNITGKQLRPLIRELNRFRRKHKDWVLVDVEDGKTGERVMIKL